MNAGEWGFTSLMLASFLEVAVHQYLYTRSVYPATLFDRKRCFQMPVHMSRHPQLNAYIARALEGVRPQLDRHLLGALAIVLVEEASGVPVERLVFNFLSFPDASSTRDRLEDTCRSFLLKIAMIEGALGRARHEGGGGLTFRIVAQSRGGGGGDGMGAGGGGRGERTRARGTARRAVGRRGWFCGSRKCSRSSTRRAMASSYSSL